MAKKQDAKPRTRKPAAVPTPPPPPADDALGVVAAAAVKSREPVWFWENRLEMGTVAILQGEKGAGKSTWLRCFAAVATGGAVLPMASKTKKKWGKVLYFAGEESVDTRVQPCLEAAGADLDGVFIADSHGHFGRRLELPADCDKLKAAVKSMGVALVIVDPLFNFLSPSADLSGPTEPARTYMRRVGEVAAETGCLILLSRNLQKRRSDGALSAGRGSLELANCARSVLHAQGVPNGTEKALAVAACNSGTASAETITYRIGDRDGFGVIHMTGTTSASADELVSGESGHLDRSLMDQCKALVQAVLGTERVASTTIKARAEAAGLAMRTVQAAAQSLGVWYEREGAREDLVVYWNPPKGGWARDCAE